MLSPFFSTSKTIFFSFPTLATPSHFSFPSLSSQPLQIWSVPGLRIRSSDSKHSFYSITFSPLALNSICIQWLPKVWVQSSPNEPHTLNSNWLLDISSWMSNENSNINMGKIEPSIAHSNWGVSHPNCSGGKNVLFCISSYFSSTQKLLLIQYTSVLSFHLHCQHLVQIPPHFSLPSIQLAPNWSQGFNSLPIYSHSSQSSLFNMEIRLVILCLKLPNNFFSLYFR